VRRSVPNVDVGPWAEMNWMWSPSGKRFSQIERRNVARSPSGKFVPQAVSSDVRRNRPRRRPTVGNREVGDQSPNRQRRRTSKAATRSASKAAISDALSRSTVAMLVVEVLPT